jgi:hypothetical protein
MVSIKPGTAKLALTTGAVFVRDSKNPEGPVPAWAPAALGALLGRVKDGRFDGWSG